MKNYRVLAVLVFISAIIQFAFGLFFKFSGMIGNPESTWIFILLCISAVISAAIAVFFFLRS